MGWVAGSEVGWRGAKYRLQGGVAEYPSPPVSRKQFVIGHPAVGHVASGHRPASNVAHVEVCPAGRIKASH